MSVWTDSSPRYFVSLNEDLKFEDETVPLNKFNKDNPDGNFREGYPFIKLFKRYPDFLVIIYSFILDWEDNLS